MQLQTKTQQLMLLVLNTVMHLYIFTVWVAQVVRDCICLHFYGVLPLVRQLSTPHHCTLHWLLARKLALGANGAEMPPGTLCRGCCCEAPGLSLHRIYPSWKVCERRRHA